MGVWGTFFWVLITALPAWPGVQRKAQLIHRESNLHRRWVDHYKEDRANLYLLFELMENSPTGKSLLARARRQTRQRGLQLHQLIQPGTNSLTDTTLIRRFQKSRPQKLKYRIHSQILINRELTTANAVLDLAHELVHFIQQNRFNPYSTKFTPLQFLTSTITGKGGEVDAYIAECKVLDELFGAKRIPYLESSQSKCGQIRHGNGDYSRQRAIQLFYQVGEHYPKITQVFGYLGLDLAKFPAISPQTPVFISATYNVPYPLASLKEYLSIMAKACQNDQRRMALQASRNVGATNDYFRKVQQDYFKRCSNPILFQARDALYSINKWSKQW